MENFELIPDLISRPGNHQEAVELRSLMLKP